MIFLINKTDAIGETILALPMAKMLKEKYPNSKVIYLVTPKSSDVLKNSPYIDEIRVYHRDLRFYLKIRQILRLFNEIKPTHYIYVGGGYLPNFVSWMKGVGFRGGVRSKWHTYFSLNKGVRQKRSMVIMHEMEYNLNLLSPLGITYSYKQKRDYTPEIFLTQDEVEKNFNNFKKYLVKDGYEPDRKMIFIHPGIGGSTLNWSSRNYARLILKLENKFPNKYLYVVSHTSNDLNFLHGLKELLNRKENKFLEKRVYFLNGNKDGLRSYMCVLSHAVLFVGPSTGPLHIAAALGVPSVAIYSPIKTQSTLRWGPMSVLTEKVRIQIPDVICGEVSKCALKACPYYECMGKIEVEDILKNAIELIS